MLDAPVHVGCKNSGHLRWEPTVSHSPLSEFSFFNGCCVSKRRLVSGEVSTFLRSSRTAMASCSGLSSELHRFLKGHAKIRLHFAALALFSLFCCVFVNDELPTQELPARRLDMAFRRRRRLGMQVQLFDRR